MKIKTKIIAIILLFAVSFTSTFFVKKANAIDVAHIAVSAGNLVTTIVNTVSEVGSFAWQVGQKAYEVLRSQSVLMNKMAALLAVQAATKLVIGDGNEGTIIRDFNEYLFISPQQRALTQMNSFFNTVSKGRLSSLNYEGVGPNYDAYLVAQSRMAFGGQKFSTTLQEQVTDPTQLFATGNMKGIMTYMQCANNVACYTLTSNAKYQAELSKAQEIARTENVNGFIPKKKNGRVFQPAALAQSALSQMDQLGTQVIMNADQKDGITGIEQVWVGAGISTTARLTNYGISDKAGRDKIRDKNSEFPFSLSYTLNGGLGISAGGVTVSTGAGAVASQLAIGNTCAMAVGSVNANGAVVIINGRKMAKIDGKEYDCSTVGQTSITPPAVNTKP